MILENSNTSATQCVGWAGGHMPPPRPRCSDWRRGLKSRHRWRSSSLGPLAASFRCPAPPDLANSGSSSPVKFWSYSTISHDHIAHLIVLLKSTAENALQSFLIRFPEPFECIPVIWLFTDKIVIYAKRPYFYVKLRSTFHKFGPNGPM